MPKCQYAKMVENDSKIGQSKTFEEKKTPPQKKLFMSRLWSEYADNKLTIVILERKADKFPKSHLRLSLA